MHSPSWKFTTLGKWYLFLLLWVGSFLFPPTRALWDFIDLHAFRLLNDSLRGSHAWQVFWALANTRAADWFEDICFALLIGGYVSTLPRGQRKSSILSFFVCGLIIGLVIAGVNEFIFRRHWILGRYSPSAALEDVFRLSQHLHWIKIKDISHSCFPADHATTAILFASCYSYLTRGKWRAVAIAYAVFLCIPRMIMGAHWLTDALIGSGAIVIVSLTTLFCTPLFSLLHQFFMKIFRGKSSSASVKASSH